MTKHNQIARPVFRTAKKIDCVRPKNMKTTPEAKELESIYKAFGGVLDDIFISDFLAALKELYDDKNLIDKLTYQKNPFLDMLPKFLRKLWVKYITK